MGSTSRGILGLLQESTEGTLETGGAYERILNSSTGPQARSKTVDDPTMFGTGESQGDDVVLRACDLSVDARFRHHPTIMTLLRGPLRRSTAFPAAVSVVGSSDINVVLAGTHQDGSTGPQITVGDTSSFDTLIAYDGAAENGIEGLLVKVTGSAEEANNRKRWAKSVWKDGSTSYIDIHPASVAGPSGSVCEPMVATAAESITVAVGRACRNLDQEVSFSSLHYFADEGWWQAGFGMVGNNLGISYSGQDGIDMSVSYLGYGSTAPALADPTGQGFAAAAAVTPQMHSGAHLKAFVLLKPTAPLILSAAGLNAYELDYQGNCAAWEDDSGSGLVTDIRRGTSKTTGSIGVTVRGNSTIVDTFGLGYSDTIRADSYTELKDGDGNEVVWGFRDARFEPHFSGSGGGDQQLTGSIGYAARPSSTTSRTIFFQFF